MSRVPRKMIQSLWFPLGIDSIWVVCPQIHDPGEFADRRNPDFTYLDNLGDTDSLLELMIFLARNYPNARIEKFSSSDLPIGHTKGKLVVIGGPGTPDSISNAVCQQMMQSAGSRVSYTEDMV